MRLLGGENSLQASSDRAVSNLSTGCVGAFARSRGRNNWAGWMRGSHTVMLAEMQLHYRHLRPAAMPWGVWGARDVLFPSRGFVPMTENDPQMPDRNSRRSMLRDVAANGLSGP